MWNIAICDDEPLAQQQLAALWRQHIDAAQYRLFFLHKRNRYAAGQPDHPI